ncbi:hypothetical protein FLONG3_8291 [Fusarium longipes]|uniref:Secreted protein n=1 Tax=Fusarium longipes TaxID=694270 RepID=A0A395S789_9HYPO|nr:hypothetical protein FLONG3_8291 [Fusarium longipes]
MVATNVPMASAWMVIALTFTIQAVPAPAIPIGKSMDVKPETRIPVADYLLEPSIPSTDGIDQIIHGMKKENDEEVSVSQEEIKASNLNYFPWGKVYRGKKERNIPDDDDDDSNESEDKLDSKAKRDMIQGMADDTGSNSAYETIHHKTLETNETTTANEPRYNRMEQFAHRPALHHEQDTHIVVPQVEESETKQD